MLQTSLLWRPLGREAVCTGVARQEGLEEETEESRKNRYR